MADSSSSNDQALAHEQSGVGPPAAPAGSSADPGTGGHLRRQYEEVAALAGGLAHEIRNPLSTIGMLLELMAEDLAAPETPRDRRMLTQLKTLQRECQHLEDILNAFLQFARVGEADLVESDVN